MSGVNKVILLGRLGQDPELRQLGSGKSISTFTLATSENWLDRDGNKQESTEWHSIEVWGKLADLVVHRLRKGSQVYVEGSLKTKQWEDQQGMRRIKTVINVKKMVFADDKPAEPEFNQWSNDHEEIPF